MALTDLLKLSNMNKEKLEDNMLYILLENFVLSDDNSNMVRELKKEVGQNEIISAFKDWSDFTDKYKIYIDKNTNEYKKIFNIFLDCMYEVLPPLYDTAYRANIIQMFMNKLSFIFFKDYTNGKELFQKFVEDFVELISRHQNLVVFLLNKFGESTKQIIHKEISDVDISNISEEQLRKMEEETKPIKIEHFSPSLRLYHGTSLENYKDILKDGFIRRSNYKNLDYSKVKENEKLYRMKYEYEDKFVFLDAGLDYPIAFSSNGYRKNILYWSRELIQEEKERKGNDNLINGDGVIFIVDPNKYNLYFYMGENQFLIDSDIDIRDTEVLFVHHEGGIITITDKKGNELNDILY